MSIHDARFQAETFLSRAQLEPLDHHRRDVDGGDVRPETRRRETYGATAGCHIQKPHALAEAGTAKRLRSQAEVGRSDELVITRRHLIPSATDVIIPSA